MKTRTLALCLALICLAGFSSVAQTATNSAAVVTNPPPKNPWDASVTLGLTITRGNSQNTLVSGAFLAAKKWDKNEVNLGINGVYGDNSGTVNAAMVTGFGQYNRLFTERFYGLARFEGLHDEIADIDYRLTVSVGAGYYLIKTTNTMLRAEIGPGYIYEKDSDIGTTNGATHSYVTLRLAERFDQRISDHAKCWESLEFLPQIDKWDNYIVNFEVGAESAMSKKLSLTVVADDTYHSEPAQNRLKNDFKLIAGVKYKF
jgi:putative salt-induced outer membrane protein YdiY